MPTAAAGHRHDTPITPAASTPSPNAMPSSGRLLGWKLAAKTAPSTTSAVKVGADSQKQGAYQPDPVTVQAGQSVTWTWEDQGNQHSVSADDGSFESCLQGAGSTFTTTFTKAGTYAYHCSIHPQMKGTVTVT